MIIKNVGMSQKEIKIIHHLTDNHVIQNSTKYINTLFSCYWDINIYLDWLKVKNKVPDVPI